MITKDRQSMYSKIFEIADDYKVNDLDGLVEDVMNMFKEQFECSDCKNKVITNKIGVKKFAMPVCSKCESENIKSLFSLIGSDSLAVKRQ